MIYYNEHDRFAAQWLRNLGAASHIPGGTVDERDIQTVGPAELAGYEQCHFFAGIGGWELALRLAGWPEDRDVWTGSCPCQPFSAAGKGKGVADERHLWPFMRELIRVRRPPTIFGEQVASAAGRDWLAGVRSDLEAMGYRFGAADLCAAGIGAPHIRQRLFWVADTRQEQRGRRKNEREPRTEGASVGGQAVIPNQRCCGIGGDGVGDPGSSRCESVPTGTESDSGKQKEVHLQESVRGHRAYPWSDYSIIMCGDGKARRIATEPRFFPLDRGVPGRVGRLRAYGNAIVPALAAEFIIAYLEATA